MKFRVVNIVTVIGMAALGIAWRQGYAPWWSLLIVLWVYVSVVAWGCINVQMGFFLPVLCRGSRNENMIALTFDDGPHPIFTPRILDALKESNAKATFFCIGKNIAGNEALLKRMKDEGHTIGNHSYSHDFWFDLFGTKKMVDDLKHMDGEVSRAGSATPKLFRPPYGVTNPNVKKAILKGGYLPVGWSIRSMDTVAKDKTTLKSKVLDNMTAGDIVLLHDHMEITADVLPELITEIAKKGLRIETVDKILKVNAYA